MREELHAADSAAAHVLAMMVAANGHVDPSELRVLEGLDAFRRLGVTRQRFVDLARRCIEDVGASLCERSWLGVEDQIYVDELLDAVVDMQQRLLVCRLAAAVVTADGRVTHGERLVFDHALARWRISQSMVSKAILNDHSH